MSLAIKTLKKVSKKILAHSDASSRILPLKSFTWGILTELDKLALMYLYSVLGLLSFAICVSYLTLAFLIMEDNLFEKVR